MKKRLLLLMVLTVIISLIATIGFGGCKREAETTAAEPLVFGNIPVALSDEWNGYSVENFEYAAAKKGVEVIVLDPIWDGEKALANLEDLIARDVDHISVFVYTPEQAQDFITRTNEANIPISIENTKLTGQVTGDYVVNVAVEYYEVGYQAVKYLSEAYEGARVFYVRGMPGMGIIEEYMRGIEQALEDTGNKITIPIMRDTMWNTETGQNATMDVIAAGEEFDVIFANNESIAVGCYNALKDAGMETEIPIIATGGGPTGIQQLKDGIIAASIACPVSLQGLYLFKAMWLYSSQGIEPPEKFIDYIVQPITLDTLDKNISWVPSDELIDMIGGLDSW
jgi:ABC-type sugar transport system substrate-binding protein